MRIDLTDLLLDTYSRVSLDPKLLEAGVGRQQIDTGAKVSEVGACLGKAHVENDTSAFRKKKVTITDHYGNTYAVWRVIRPVWAEALQRLRRGEADGLVVDDLDRLARDPRDLEDAIEVVEHYGKVIISATASEIDLTTESGILTARMLVNMANKASRDTSRRVKNELRHRAMRGEVSKGGTRPFGWQDDRVSLNLSEAALIRQAVEDVTHGKAIERVAREWNAEGVTTPWNGPWNFSNVKNVITRPRLVGIRTFNGETVLDAQGEPVQGQWATIVSEAELEALTAALAAKAKPRRRRAKYMLGALLRCGECGAPMWGNYQGVRNTARYACSDEGHTSIAAGRAEETVTLMVGLRLMHVQNYLQTRPTAEEEGQEQVFPKEGAIKELEANIKLQVKNAVAYPKDAAAFMEAADELRGELAALTKERGLWSAERTRWAKDPLTFNEWMLSDEDTKRAIIEQYCTHILIKPTYAGSPYVEKRIVISWSEEAKPWGDEPPAGLKSFSWEEDGEEEEVAVEPAWLRKHGARSEQLPAVVALLKENPRATSTTVRELTGIGVGFARELLAYARAQLEIDPDYEPPKLPKKRIKKPRDDSNSPYFAQVRDVMAAHPEWKGQEIAETLGISKSYASRMMMQLREVATQTASTGEAS